LFVNFNRTIYCIFTIMITLYRDTNALCITGKADLA